MNFLAQRIYDSACGLLTEDAQLPNVEDAFAEGSPCSVAYESMLLAYERLRHRLNVPNEDPDIEQIISSLTGISKILGLQMFHYGFLCGSGQWKP